MKRLARSLSYLAAFAGGLLLIRPRLELSKAVLWIPKTLAEACSPFTAAIGALGALLGLGGKDSAALVAGMFGALTASRHIQQVGGSVTAFREVFGTNWQERIDPERRLRLPDRWWTPFPSDPPYVPWQRDVVIGDHLETDDPLLADLWYPPPGVPRTEMGVLYLHGSGWHYLDKDVRTRRFFRHLAAQGHLVVDVAYTLAPRARLLPMLADVKRTIAWVKANAETLEVAPERIVLIGASAGGHLALLAAYAPDHPELTPADVRTDATVRAVVSYYGPIDLVAQHDYFKTVFKRYPSGKNRLERWFIDRWETSAYRNRLLPPYGHYIAPQHLLPSLLGGTPEEIPELYQLSSPIAHVGKHCPPTLLVQGAHDFGGMAPDVRRLHRALRRAGVPSLYLELPHTDHAFDLLAPRWSPAAQAATFATDHFLALMI